MKKFNRSLSIIFSSFFIAITVLMGVYVYAATYTTIVNLQSAAGFAVLAGSGITSTNPPQVIVGDAGSSPTVSNGLTGAEVSGTNYTAGSAVVDLAKDHLTAAYLDAESRTGATVLSASTYELGGETLTPGIYKIGTGAEITGNLTLDAENDPDAVFIFQIGSTLTTASAAQVLLIRGAQPCNVFWQVTSSATLGTGTQFVGNILALESITDNGGSTVNGRLLARNAAVTLNNTHVTKQTCTTPPALSGGGGNKIPPVISIVKVPSPLALPSGPGSVTYTYTVVNVGGVKMNDVVVTDDKCTPVNYVSGNNAGSTLDANEVWTYTCTTTVDRTTTNIATVTASANDWRVIDTANATVVVGVPLVPPLIHVVKKPSQLLLPYGGGLVTYTYTVTNPGTVPLSNVSVADNKCSGLPPARITGHPGDLNKNNLLEPDEIWTFTCSTNLTITTTNTGIAEGSANGFTAIDYALATVAVATPGLPKTGLDFSNEHTLWNVINSIGVVTLLALFFVTKKKETI
ncbi:MAG: ice-binding family protein [bacterium]|nr:ice-binding family protein [bacterium]